VSSPRHSYDLTILGSGPGGYVAAIRAGQLGLRTAVVEMHAQPGGTCLHWGCIPTKAMLHAAEVLETARHASRFGVRVSGAELDLPAMHAYKDATVQANARGVEFLLKKNQVALLHGRARLAGAGRVEVRPEGGEAFQVETAHVLIAVGSVVRGLPGVVSDGTKVISSDEALKLPRVPRSLVVLGAGAVGVEFASIYRSFGAEVSVVELEPRLIPLEDDALGTELARAFGKRGITCHTATRVTAVDAAGPEVRIVAEKSGKRVELAGEVLLVAVGRRPRTEDIGLEGTRVELRRGGFIGVDAMMRTAEPGVYAIGDVLETQALAHLASHEGIVAVEHIAGLDPAPIDYDHVPSCTYCRPEVGSVGLSEERARARGIEVEVGRFPFSAMGKAKILGETGGFVKIVADKKYGEVLGVHIIGPHATELIAEATVALGLEATVESIVHAIHAHPTLSEALGEAALAVRGRAIHI
jgi:dihydrolipoamide dehydrogenase